MSRIRCFMVELTGQVGVWRRRYRSSAVDVPCGSGASYCDARTFVGNVDGVVARRHVLEEEDPALAALWPAKCDLCGYVFAADDRRQIFTCRLAREAGTEGPDFPMNELPAGAMYYVDQISERSFYPLGPDGRSLMVKTPGGEWCVDSRASNCTRRDDDRHRCWVRHGMPPLVTVDKVGDTCAAGAGSIGCGSYHGFLRGGYLEG